MSDHLESGKCILNVVLDPPMAHPVGMMVFWGRVACGLVGTYMLVFQGCMSFFFFGGSWLPVGSVFPRIWVSLPSCTGSCLGATPCKLFLSLLCCYWFLACSFKQAQIALEVDMPLNTQTPMRLLILHSTYDPQAYRQQELTPCCNSLSWKRNSIQFCHTKQLLWEQNPVLPYNCPHPRQNLLYHHEALR